MSITYFDPKKPVEELAVFENHVAKCTENYTAQEGGVRRWASGWVGELLPYKTQGADEKGGQMGANEVRKEQEMERCRAYVSVLG